MVKEKEITKDYIENVINGKIEISIEKMNNIIEKGFQNIKEDINSIKEEVKQEYVTKIEYNSLIEKSEDHKNRISRLEIAIVIFLICVAGYYLTKTGDIIFK